jgi:hypothetical protein
MDDEIQELAEQVRALRAAWDNRGRPEKPMAVPSVAEFIISPDYLNQDKIYPWQLSMQRLFFLDLDGMTAYDHDVYRDLGSGFERMPIEPGSTRWLYEPTRGREYVRGMPPDVLDRVEELLAQGRRWFREMNLVWGRRGSKGHSGALAGARLLYELLALGNPQAHFGIPKDKKLLIPVFAGKQEQARFNLWADYVTAVVNGPCFGPHVMDLQRDRLIIATQADLERPDRPFLGSIEIVASASTGIAGRGPATPFQFYDEMAYIDPASGSASAEEVYGSATPALDQFGEWAAVMELSSPFHQTGEFYEIHCRGRELDPQTGTAAYPEILTVQVPSWEAYKDHDRATTIPMVTKAEAARSTTMRDADGHPRCFPPVGRPISTDDAQMAQLRRAKPKEFRVERLAQWRTVIDAFLEPDIVESLFKPFRDVPPRPTERPILNKRYILMIDAAEKHDAFVWLIGHREPSADEGRAHVVGDLVRRWLPSDYGGQLPLDEVLAQLEDDIRTFNPDRVIADQHGGTYIIQWLEGRFRRHPLPRRSSIEEHSRTHQKNLDAGAVFREAMHLGQVHWYPHQQLRLELLFLQEVKGRIAAPTRGPVQFDDLAIALMFLVEALLGDDPPIFDALGGLPVGGHPGPGLDAGVRGLFDEFRQASRRSRSPLPPRQNPRWRGR